MTPARTRKPDVLDHVATDLAQGRTDPAIRRLASLVAAHPTDLDLRRRLAAAHRLDGNDVQAGRWDYLSVDADAEETAAFERAYPRPGERLRRLRWPGRADQPPTEFARARLAELTAAAARARGATGGASTRWLPPLLAALTCLAVIALAVLGAVTVVQWLV
jgi:uncharacterized protein involved in type VI secretion and phage assembly